MTGVQTCALPIWEHFAPGNLILEIGSGTAQHVTFFAQMMPQVQWQPSDMSANMPTLIAGLDGNSLANIAAPLALDVGQATWPIGDAGGVFTANTLHIMSYASVECFFRGVGEVLQRGSCLCVYGPFKYNNAFTTPSNAQFDLWLKARDPVSGGSRRSAKPGTAGGSRHASQQSIAGLANAELIDAQNETAQRQTRRIRRSTVAFTHAYFATFEFCPKSWKRFSRLYTTW